MDRITGLCTQIPTPRREASFSSDRGFFLRSGGRMTWWAELGHAAGHPAWSCLLRSGIPPGIRVGNVTGVTYTGALGCLLPLSLKGSQSTEAGIPKWGFVVIWQPRT